MIERGRLFYFFIGFGIFLCIVVITGYLQVSVLKRNMEALLSKEAEVAYGHFVREININFEYLDMIDRSLFMMTPSFLDVMAQEEAVIEDLIEGVSEAVQKNQKEIPVSKYVLIDRDGEVRQKKGSIKQVDKLIHSLLSEKERVVIKTSSSDDTYVTFGLKVDDKIIVVSLTKEEMKELKRKYMLKEIVEKETERLKIVGVNIYDPKGRPYYVSYPSENSVFKFKKPLDSNYLPGYYVEIILSRDVIDEALRKTISYLLVTLFFLLMFTGLTGYMIFLVEKKMEKKRIEFERELARNERLLSLGMLSSTMAHEIRNPLNAISLSIERLRRDFLPDDSHKDEYQRFLDVVGKEIQRINRIVEDFLLLSRPQHKLERIQVKTMIDEILVLLKEKAEAKNIELENLIPDKVSIVGQREKLKQAFFNLILNGVEAVESGGYVKITAYDTERAVSIFIEDNGCGIAPGEIEKIFEYHYTTKDKGLGLGLPISYMIVKEHKGEIKVKSEKGKGTVIEVSLPNSMEII